LNACENENSKTGNDIVLKPDDSSGFFYNSRPFHVANPTRHRILPKPDAKLEKENSLTNNRNAKFPDENMSRDCKIISNSCTPKERWLKAFESIKRQLQGVSS
jgi:hypothetical protein